MSRVHLIHCSYHKCLTVYYGSVVGVLYNKVLPLSKGYKHFKSRLDDFYSEYGSYKLASLNNQSLDLDRLGDFRITRFIRDPRDLVVSGYFYHRRGGEEWCNRVNPNEEDWEYVNGHVPECIPPDHSFSSYLQNASQEEGLMAEIDFRKRHFDSMVNWPLEHPAIKVIRYEDLIGNEEEVFRDIFTFYECPWPEVKLGMLLSKRYAANKRKGTMQHIRNPEPAQWKRFFTPAVSAYFEDQHPGLPERLGYERE